MKRKNKAFTLVELLVVLGVIALLMGILVPVLNAALEKGRSISCRSNLRNMGFSLRMYLDDNNNVMPPAALKPSVNTEKKPITDYLLKRVDKDKKVFKCPSDKDDPTFYETEGTSYAYSMGLGGKPVDKSFLTIRFKATEDQIHVLNDMESFHGPPGKVGSMNYLFADCHVGDLRGK